MRAYDDGIRITIRDRDDDDLLVETLARVLDRPVAGRRGAPAARVRHLRATAETRIAVRLGLDGASRVARRRPAPGSTTTSSSSSPSTPGSTSSSRARATSRPATTTRSRTRRSRSARRSTSALGDRRGIARYGDAVVPMDDALARAAVDLGGRPFAELSIEPEPGHGRALLRLARAGRADGDPRRGDRAATRTTSPRPRTRRSAARCETALRQESTGIPSTKGLL